MQQDAPPQPIAPLVAPAMTPKLAQALSTFQGELEPAELDRENPHFHSRYATLKSIMAAVRPGLVKNGLAILQRPSHHDRGVALTTTVMHVSGEQVSSTIIVPLSKQDAQGLGSALTYARRYGICAMLGVVADEDDDGNAAAARSHNDRNQQDRRNGSYQRGNDRNPQRGQQTERPSAQQQRPPKQQQRSAAAPKGVTREMLGELMRAWGDRHNDGFGTGDEAKELFVKWVRYQLHSDAGFETLESWNLDAYGTIARALDVAPATGGDR